MRQEHSDEAYRVIIVAQGFSSSEYVYGPYARLSSARAMRTRETKYMRKQGFMILSADIQQATQWTKVDD